MTIFKLITVLVLSSAVSQAAGPRPQQKKEEKVKLRQLSYSLSTRSAISSVVVNGVTLLFDESEAGQNASAGAVPYQDDLLKSKGNTVQVVCRRNPEITEKVNPWCKVTLAILTEKASERREVVSLEVALPEKTQESKAEGKFDFPGQPEKTILEADAVTLKEEPQTLAKLTEFYGGLKKMFAERDLAQIRKVFGNGLDDIEELAIDKKNYKDFSASPDKVKFDFTADRTAFWIVWKERPASGAICLRDMTTNLYTYLKVLVYQSKKDGQFKIINE